MALDSGKIADLYQEYRVPRKVIKHMLKVAQFAAKLCDKFIKKGIEINKDLVIKAALVHDLLRVCDFRELQLRKLKQTVTSKDLETWMDIQEKHGEEGHEQAAAKLLHNLGHRQEANLVRKHDFYKVDELETWEEKLLFYADKKIEGAKIVSLKKRFKKGRERNMRPGDRLSKVETIERKVYELEQEIKSMIS